MAIYFYSKLGEYAWLSNFSLHPFTLDGRRWPTVEHYFQAQKFSDSAYCERIRHATTPKYAKELGRSRQYPLRSDWEEVKDGIMLRACRAKFAAYPDLQKLLLETGEEELVESAPNDYYWGCGSRGTGQNKLGQILVQLRGEFREAVVTGEAKS